MAEPLRAQVAALVGAIFVTLLVRRLSVIREARTASLAEVESCSADALNAEPSFARPGGAAPPPAPPRPSNAAAGGAALSAAARLASASAGGAKQAGGQAGGAKQGVAQGGAAFDPAFKDADGWGACSAPCGPGVQARCFGWVPYSVGLTRHAGSHGERER